MIDDTKEKNVTKSESEEADSDSKDVLTRRREDELPTHVSNSYDGQGRI